MSGFATAVYITLLAKAFLHTGNIFMCVKSFVCVMISSSMLLCVWGGVGGVYTLVKFGRRLV